MNAPVQQSLLDEPVPRAPAAVVDFLAGFATNYAYGEKPSAQQKRIARAAAEQFGGALAAMKAAA